MDCVFTHEDDVPEISLDCLSPLDVAKYLGQHPPEKWNQLLKGKGFNSVFSSGGITRLTLDEENSCKTKQRPPVNYMLHTLNIKRQQAQCLRRESSRRRQQALNKNRKKPIRKTSYQQKITREEFSDRVAPQAHRDGYTPCALPKAPVQGKKMWANGMHPKSSDVCHAQGGGFKIKQQKAARHPHVDIEGLTLRRIAPVNLSERGTTTINSARSNNDFPIRKKQIKTAKRPQSAHVTMTRHQDPEICGMNVIEVVSGEKPKKQKYVVNAWKNHNANKKQIIQMAKNRSATKIGIDYDALNLEEQKKLLDQLKRELLIEEHDRT